MRPLAFLVASCFAVGAEANPTGPTVVSGSAAFKQAGSLLQITNSPKAIINWQSFSIGAGEITRFIQQSSSSSVLNRVTSQNPSSILGTLQSNGRVFLINPNGIVFGAGSVINTAGLVASTLNLSNADFLSGRMNFTATPGAGSVVNQGAINGNGGGVYLVGPAVTNSGIITSPKGEVVLAAGNSVELVNPGTPNLRVEITAPDNQAVNLGQMSAESGRVGIYAGLINHSGSVRADSAEIGADGRIVLKATGVAYLDAGSTISASGGSVKVEADRLVQAGTISTSSTTGSGGTIEIDIVNRVLQMESARLLADGATSGGSIVLKAGADAGNMLYSSATFSATGNKGGSISLLGRDILLLGAQVDASGAQGGGSVLVGGSFQGKDPAVPNSATTGVNFSSELKADATQNGDGGKVVVWSDNETQFYGKVSARGGAQGGDGGLLEVSGKDKLVFAGAADAGAPHGKPGSLLLDPKNIIIEAGGPVVPTGGLGVVQLIDPNPGADENFGDQTVVLPNGNIVVTDPQDGGGKGAVYLYNGTSGTWVSTLEGTLPGDNVGSGITTLQTGNYLVFSPNWASGAGAVTFSKGDPGVGPVTALNSLVGSNLNDHVGQFGVRMVGPSSANYLVLSPTWSGGAGAITFGSGTTGVTGVVGPGNSLVGSSSNDRIGSGSIYDVGPARENFVLVSTNWGNGKGAATWGSGTTGASGVIGQSNSLVGGTERLGTSINWWEQGDQIGNFGITVLPNGNYVVRSPYWANIDSATPVRRSGAVSFGDGTGGLSGIVGAGNSLVGSRDSDLVGDVPIAVLTNGHYVVPSVHWNYSRGAVTWGDKDQGVKGLISEENSLVGAGSDFVGAIGVGVYAPFRQIFLNSGVFPLPSGDYVVVSNYWGVGRGAVTFAKGGVGEAAGRTGVVSELNSLVGAVQNAGPNDVPVGGVWRPEYNGWCTTSGVCSPGTPSIFYPGGDKIGSGGISILPNGDYLVVSPLWNSRDFPTRLTPDGAVKDPAPYIWTNPNLPNPLPSAADLNGFQEVVRILGYQWVNDATTGSIALAATAAGAVTRVDGGNGNIAGTSGRAGVVDSSNSLVGYTKGDRIGEYGVQILSNGAGAVVRSPSWSNINPAETGVFSVANAGAVTFIPPTGNVTGVVTSSNSLVGSHVGDRIGFGFGSDGCTICTLPNGNYVVASPDWNSFAGAATFGKSADGGAKGVVSSSNSLVGSTSLGTNWWEQGDRVGQTRVLPGGNYLVTSGNWSNGAGAVTFGNATTGVSGPVSASNSLVGSTSSDGGITTYGDGVGWDVRILSNGNYVVNAPNWSNGAGAVTFGSGFNGVKGAVSANISLVGSRSGDNGATTWGDQVGSGGISELSGPSSGNYLVSSPSWNNGAGAVTWVNGTTGKLPDGSGPGRAVASTNSLVGSTSSDGGVTTWGDQVGSGGIYTLPNGNYVVSSPEWSIARGAATFGVGTSGVVGPVDGSITGNSLVGSTPSDNGTNTFGDRVSSGGIRALANGNYLVVSPNWSNTNALETGGAIAYHAGAVTWVDGSTGHIAGTTSRAGTVSSINSLVGKRVYTPSIDMVYDDDEGEFRTTVFGDRVGSGEVVELRDGNYVVISPNWNNGMGAVTWGSGTTGISGLVSPENSMFANGSGTANGNEDSSLRIESTPTSSFLAINPYATNGAYSGAGLVHLVTPGAGAAPLSGTGFGDRSSEDANISTETIVAVTSTGTAVTLQANNDITLRPGADILTGGGSLTMQAGRKIELNSNIAAGNGTLTLVANETVANGVIEAYREAGTGGITISGDLSGSNITLTADAMSLAAGSIHGTGTVRLQQSNPGTAIRIGAGATDTTGVLGIGADELAKISAAGGLAIGSNAAGVTGSVTVAGATTLSGANLTGGALTLQSNAGSIVLNAALSSPLDTTLSTATGGISFGSAGALSAAGKTVTLSAPGGAITGNSRATTNVTGASLLATANQGIGLSSNALTADVATLSASNTGASAAGGIYIDNARSLSLTGVTNAANGGGISIDVGGTGNDLTLSGTVSGTGAAPIDLTAARDIVFAETGSANGVSTGAGMVTLMAGRDIQGGTSIGSDVITTGAGGLIATAGGQIGAANALRTSTGASGSLSLETSGADANGNIAVVEANALNTNQVTLLTESNTAQAVSIAAPSLTVGTAAFGNAADNLSLAAFIGDIAGGIGVVTGSAVTLSAKTGIGTGTTPVRTAASTIAATNDTSGAVAISNTGDLSITGSNTGGGAFSVALDAGKQLSIGTAAPGGIVSNGGDVSLIADQMAIGGNVSTISPTRAGLVVLKPMSESTIISVGGTVADSSTKLSISDGELAKISSTGGLTIGATTNTGGIEIAGPAAASGVTAGTVTLTTGGAITRTGTGAISTGVSAGLALNAAGGIGMAGGAGIDIGAVGGPVSATNTASGDLVLNFTEATGTIKVGGTSGISQLSVGELRLDASSAIEIAGDLNAASGSITLNPTGALTRSGGTLTADRINLGTAGFTTAIGASGAGRIQVAGSSSVAAKATTGGVFLEQASGDMATGTYKLDVPTAGQAIELATTGGRITVSHGYTTDATGWNINTRDDNVTLIARGTSKDIIGNGVADLTTSGSVTFDATGGIGIGAAVRTSTAGSITLKTAGADAGGNITLIEANALDTTRLPAFTTSGTGTQTVTLTSTAGPITLGADIGNAADNLTLITAVGNIAGGTGTATAAALTLDAAGGIGAGTGVKTKTTGDITLKTAGVGTAGDITLVEANDLNTTRLPAFATSGTGTQTVRLTSTAGPITLGADIGNAADNLALIAAAGNIAGGTGTATATAAALTLDAAGSIGAGTAVKTNTTGDITLKTTGADTAGDIMLVEANALNTTRLPAFTTSGTGTQTVRLTSTAGPITLGADIGNAADILNLTAATQNIVGGTGIVSGSTVTLNAKTGIGSATAPVQTAAASVDATNSTSGAVAISSAEATTVTGSNTGGGAFNVALGAGKLLTVGPSGIASNGGAVNLIADQMTISGNVDAGIGLTTVKPVTMTGTVIMVGGTAADGTGVLAIDDTEAGKFAGSGGLTISSTGAGGIQLSDAAAFTNVTGGTVSLATGGAITHSGTGAISTGGAGISLNAANGIGTISTNAGIDIGTMSGGSLSATNTTSGDMFLNFTGASARSVGGTSGISQFSGGSLRFDSGGPMEITGNLDAGAGSITLNPTGALTRSSGMLTADTINLGTAGTTTSIGATGGGRIWVAGSTAVSARATTGGVFLEQASGDMATSGYKLDVPGASQSVELVTSSGKITLDHNYTTDWNTNTQDDSLKLIAQGAGKDIVGNGTATLTTSGSVTLIASGGIGTTSALRTATTGNISATTSGTDEAGKITLIEIANALNTNNVTLATGSSAQTVSIAAPSITVGAAAIGNTTDSIILTASTGGITGGAGAVTGSNVTLDSATGVGASGARVTTAAGTLAARSTTSGGVFVSEADGVTLATIGTVTNNASSNFDLTAVGSITVGTGGVSATGDVILTSAGSITGTGLVSGSKVTLDSATGVGASGARVNTAAGTLAARSTASGGVFVSEANGVTLDTVGTVANTAAGTNAYDVTAAGSVAVEAGGANTAGSGNTNLAATGAVTSNVALNGAVGNATGDTTISSAGNIGGTGIVTAANLTLNAVKGVGNIANDTGINIDASGSVAAKNTASGDLFVNYVGANSLDVGGASGIEQLAPNGSLRFDSGGAMRITGDLSAGSGSLTLNPNGALTRSAGTLTANTINLGTKGNTTSIGATGAGRVLVAGGTAAPTVTAHATAGGVFLEQASGDIATSKYSLIAAGLDPAIELVTTNGKITVDDNVAAARLMLSAQGTGKDIVGDAGRLTGSTNLTLNASGGIGAGVPVNITAPGTINLTTGGVGSSGNIDVQAGDSMVIYNGSLSISTNPAVASVNPTVQSVRLGSDGSITLGAGTNIIAAGDLTLHAGREIEVGGDVTAGHDLSLIAGRDMTIRGNLAAGNDLSLAAGRHLLISDVTGTAGNLVNVTTENFILEARNRAAQLIGSKGSNIFVSGTTTLQGGFNVDAFAEIAGGAAGALNLGTGNLILRGGGPGAYARLLGNPDVTLTILGRIVMEADPLGGGYAGIAAVSPTTIYVSFPNRSSGGYFVNGVESVVFDPATASGFVAGGRPALLDQNVVFTYGGTLQLNGQNGSNGLSGPNALAEVKNAIGQPVTGLNSITWPGEPGPTGAGAQSNSASRNAAASCSDQNGVVTSGVCVVQ